MAMSDCQKCWDTPCGCGWDYRRYSIEYLEKMRQIFERAVEFKTRNPSAVFSELFKPETPDDKAFMEYIRQ